MRSLLVVLLTCAATFAPAQIAASAPRSDGAVMPLMVYGNAKTPDGECAPVILFSHGLGGSETGYAYFGNGLAAAGYRVIMMGHRESGMDFLKDEIRAAHGMRAGLLHAVEDRNAEAARLLDVEATLKFADQACHANFVALAGHSMGAMTAMLEAGAKNVLNLAPSAGAGRIAAFVALSPEGPGPVFAANGWSGIHAPVLMMTGTRDQGTAGDYLWREQAFTGLPPAGNTHGLAVIDGASHMDFARRASEGVGADVITATTAFLGDVRSGDWKQQPPPMSGVTWQRK